MVRKISLIMASLAVVSGIGVAAWLFTGASTNTADAHSILRTAAEKQTVIETYKVVARASQTSPVDEFDVYESTETAFVVAGRGGYLITEATGGYDEYLILPNKQYQRASATGPWVEMPTSSDGYVLPTLDSKQHANVLSLLLDPEVQGTETYKGIEATKITGLYDLDSKAESIWGDFDNLDDDMKAGIRPHRDQMLSGEERFTAWISNDSGLIYGYTTSGSYPANGDPPAYQTLETVEFSNFNATFTLPNPSDIGESDIGESENSTDDDAAPTPTPVPDPDDTDSSTDN